MSLGSKKWDSSSEVTIQVTSEELEDLGIFVKTDTEGLILDVNHRGYYEPAVITNDPEFSSAEEWEIEIKDIDSGWIITSDGETYDDLNEDDFDKLLDDEEMRERIIEEIPFP